MLENFVKSTMASRVARTCANVLQKPYLVLRSPDATLSTVVSDSEMWDAEDTMTKFANWTIVEKWHPE